MYHPEQTVQCEKAQQSNAKATFSDIKERSESDCGVFFTDDDFGNASENLRGPESASEVGVGNDE